MCQNIQVASAYGAREATVGLVLAVFGFEGRFHIPGETFAFGLAVGVIEEDVGLGAFAAAVYMDEDGPAVLEFLAILPVEGVDFSPCRFPVCCWTGRPRRGYRLWHPE